MSGSTANLAWTASTDNVGVLRYNVHRATTAGFTPSAANRIAQPTGTTYSDAGLAAGSYFYKVVAEDAAGNLSGASNEATAVVGADGTPPTAPSGLTAGVSGTSVSLAWTAATDNIGVTRYNVHRATTSGFTPSTANRIAQPTVTNYSDAGRPPGTYYYKVTAEDAAGNVGPASSQATATVQAPSTGLVAAYGFEEGTGTTTADRIEQREHRHAVERDLVDGRQVRQRPVLQRHQRTGERPRLELARPHERDDASRRGSGHRSQTRATAPWC